MRRCLSKMFFKRSEVCLEAISILFSVNSLLDLSLALCAASAFSQTLGFNLSYIHTISSSLIEYEDARDLRLCQERFNLPFILTSEMVVGTFNIFCNSIESI